MFRPALRSASALLVVLLAPPIVADDEAKVSTVGVVKTWQTLRAQPAIDIGNGLKVRLGLEANRVQRNGGCLAYCLVSGSPKENPVTESTGRQLGPLSMTVRHRDARHRGKDGRVTEVAQQPRRPGPELFTQSIPIPAAGSYDVEFVAPDGNVIARAKVEGLEQSSHPWITFGSPDGDPQDPQEELRRIGQVPVEYVTAPGDGVAIPNGEPVDSRQYPQQIGPDDETPLPTLIPKMPTKDFRLSLRGSTFEITSSVEFDGESSTRLLARWWVNDEPFTNVPRDQRQEGLHRQHESARELHLHVAVDAKRFGAKRGDRIGVQLLYCPEGYEQLIDLHARVVVHLRELREIRIHEEGARPERWLSNKVVFVQP